MITKATLIIMAAGMGSRYGGLKQMDPVTPQGEILLDFSLYDAMMAGFKDVVFIIREEHQEAFNNLLQDRAAKYINMHFAYQKLDDLPKGFSVPEGRTKPWGTCQAVMAARDLVKGPFAVINADDYYGPGAFAQIYDFLSQEKSPSDQNTLPATFAMVGYPLKNTLSESGHVARGVCQVDEESYLTDIVERTKIWRLDSGEIIYEDENTGEQVELSEESFVSMNFWGYTQEFMTAMIEGFPVFLENALNENPLKAEYFLPSVVDKMISDRTAKVKILPSHDKWYGMTYQEDKALVSNAIQSMKDKGLYPDKLWK
ncbi:NDP-sugar synthase [Eubacteriales bacterium KG127]